MKCAPFFGIDLFVRFVLIYACLTLVDHFIRRYRMATKTNYILKVQDAKLADVQKALKDANITVVSIMEIHKEEA